MDTSEVYIKMCEKAEEIQALCRSLRDKDKAEHQDSIHTYEDNSGEGWNIIFPYDDNNEWGYNDAVQRPHYCWLPRQDQLQEMIEHKSPQMLADYYVSIGCPDLSYEQLWLAFVMSEKYGKIWDGDRWTKC